MAVPTNFTAVTQQTAKTLYVEASPGIQSAYRRFGAESGTPLAFINHFRASMDDWDPLLINTIAAKRPVILLDYAGVGKSEGSVAGSISEEADHIASVLAALNIPQVDILGFSIGGMVAQVLALNHPTLVRRLIVAGSTPSAGEGVQSSRHDDVFTYATKPEAGFDDLSVLFFAPTETSQAAARAFWERRSERSFDTSGEERSSLLSWQFKDGGAGMQAQGKQIELFTNPATSSGRDGSYDRLGELTQPTLVANGHDDYMIPTVNSFVLEQRATNARLQVYPDSGHGFLFQYAEEFGEQVALFLERE